MSPSSHPRSLPPAPAPQPVSGSAARPQGVNGPGTDESETIWIPVQVDRKTIKRTLAELHNHVAGSPSPPAPSRSLSGNSAAAAALAAASSASAATSASAASHMTGASAASASSSTAVSAASQIAAMSPQTPFGSLLTSMAGGNPNQPLPQADSLTDLLASLNTPNQTVDNAALSDLVLRYPLLFLNADQLTHLTQIAAVAATAAAVTGTAPAAAAAAATASPRLALPNSSPLTASSTLPLKGGPLGTSPLSYPSSLQQMQIRTPVQAPRTVLGGGGGNAKSVPPYFPLGHQAQAQAQTVSGLAHSMHISPHTSPESMQHSDEPSLEDDMMGSESDSLLSRDFERSSNFALRGPTSASSNSPPMPALQQSAPSAHPSSSNANDNGVLQTLQLQIALLRQSLGLDRIANAANQSAAAAAAASAASSSSLTAAPMMSTRSSTRRLGQAQAQAAAANGNANPNAAPNQGSSNHIGAMSSSSSSSSLSASASSSSTAPSAAAVASSSSSALSSSPEQSGRPLRGLRAKRFIRPPSKIGRPRKNQTVNPLPPSLAAATAAASIAGNPLPPSLLAAATAASQGGPVPSIEEINKATADAAAENEEKHGEEEEEEDVFPAEEEEVVDEDDEEYREEKASRKKSKEGGTGTKRRRKGKSGSKKLRKIFICQAPGCGDSFTTRFSLRRHMKRHTGEKPFECEMCEKKFAEKSTLLRHLLIHTGEKPFKCDVGDCQKAFADHANLKHHLRSVHKSFV